MVRMWFGEIPCCCSLTLLIGPARVLLNCVLQTIFFEPCTCPAAKVTKGNSNDIINKTSQCSSFCRPVDAAPDTLSQDFA